MHVIEAVAENRVLYLPVIIPKVVLYNNDGLTQPAAILQLSKYVRYNESSLMKRERLL
jgi:hypothetical protein